MTGATPPRAAPGAALGRFVEARARAEGFDDAAVVPADTPLAHVAQVQQAMEQGRHGPLSWLADTVDQRVDIRVRYPWARSVLVVVQSYYTGDHAERVPDLEGKAKVARYAWGNDYHNTLRRRLRRVRRALLEEAGGGRCAPFLDVDAVLERGWAHAAGLGFIGKSALFIHRGLGTWTFLGGLCTDLDLGARQREPMSEMCGSCTACMDACPTKAITAPHTVDAGRCLVTWNVEESAHPQAAAFAGHGWAVGCDVCQEVCPWNRFQKVTDEPRLQPIAGHLGFDAAGAPTDVAGTPLARPGVEALPLLAAWALKKVT